MPQTLSNLNAPSDFTDTDTINIFNPCKLFEAQQMSPRTQPDTPCLFCSSHSTSFTFLRLNLDKGFNFNF